MLDAIGRMTGIGEGTRCGVFAGLLVLGAGTPLAGQQVEGDGGRTGAAPPPAVAHAQRATAPLVLDGRLDEPAWQAATALTGFTQREPNEGEPARDATTVRILYDESALWIGARMAADPGTVRADVTRRDADSDAEQLVISLDTYHDQRTAYTFVVTAAGARIDYFHDRDSEGSTDESFDPVWETRTEVDDSGWTAEVRIPFTQLRFNPGSEQVWGLNVVRKRPALQHESYWVLVRRDETGWSSRMGELRGISGIQPSRRIELRPYVATSATMRSGVDAANPFEESRTASARVGGDLKMGLGPNLTLDATFNPDFGQVEADPAVVNLSAYEVFFDERRPFFTEGANLFNVGNLFYSRRIGAAPHGNPDADYVEDLGNTTIIGAAKVTGRLPSGLSVGVLGAVTDQEKVSTYDASADEFSRVVVEPLTGYGVVRMDQQYGASGSNIGFILTGVERGLDGHPGLAAILDRQALSGALDGRIRWKGGEYDVNYRAQFTHIRGTEEAMVRQQRSSHHYYQRPDAAYLGVDSTRTSLTGYNISVGHSRNSGEHWLWDVDAGAESPGFEPNDLGSFNAGDALWQYAGITYRETQPVGPMRNYRIAVMQNGEWNYGGTHTGQWWGLNLSGRFRNYWYGELGVDYNPSVLSGSRTRGGPLMRTPTNLGPFVVVESPDGRRLKAQFASGGGRDEVDGWWYWIEPELEYQPSPRLQLSLEPRYNRSSEDLNYVDQLGGGSAATYGGRYVFARLDNSELAAQVRANLALSPDLTLETYVEPFVSSGHYREIGELAAARTFDIRRYGTDGTTLTRDAEGDYVVADGADSFTIGNPDFNVRSFRSSAVLRWEWRPGSTLFLVWQQSRSGRGPLRRPAEPADLARGLGDAGDNFLAIKATYWLPL